MTHLLILDNPICTIPSVMPSSQGGQGIGVHQAAGPMPGRESGEVPFTYLGLGVKLVRIRVLSLALSLLGPQASPLPLWALALFIYRTGRTALWVKGYCECVRKAPRTQ